LSMARNCAGRNQQRYKDKMQVFHTAEYTRAPGQLQFRVAIPDQERL
jgi:hypothetical protein